MQDFFQNLSFQTNYTLSCLLFFFLIVFLSITTILIPYPFRINKNLKHDLTFTQWSISMIGSIFLVFGVYNLTSFILDSVCEKVQLKPSVYFSYDINYKKKHIYNIYQSNSLCDSTLTTESPVTNSLVKLEPSSSTIVCDKLISKVECKESNHATCKDLILKHYDILLSSNNIGQPYVVSK